MNLAYLIDKLQKIQQTQGGYIKVTVHDGLDPSGEVEVNRVDIQDTAYNTDTGGISKEMHIHIS